MSILSHILLLLLLLLQGFQVVIFWRIQVKVGSFCIKMEWMGMDWIGLD